MGEREPSSRRLANTQRFFISFATNTLDPTEHLLSSKVTYTVPGRSALSGVFRGPDEVKAHICRLHRFLNGTYDILKWVDWLEGESHVAGIQYVQVQSHRIRYRGHQVYVVTFDENDALLDIKILFEDESQALRLLAQGETVTS